MPRFEVREEICAQVFRVYEVEADDASDAEEAMLNSGGQFVGNAIGDGLSMSDVTRTVMQLGPGEPPGGAIRDQLEEEVHVGEVADLAGEHRFYGRTRASLERQMAAYFRERLDAMGFRAHPVPGDYQGAHDLYVTHSPGEVEVSTSVARALP